MDKALSGTDEEYILGKASVCRTHVPIKGAHPVVLRDVVSCMDFLGSQYGTVS